MAITKEMALDFFADLLPSVKKKETLFDTPVVKPKRMQRRWTVSHITVLHQSRQCECCGNREYTLNPHLLLTKQLNDFDGKIIKTMQTDLPDESDFALVTVDTPIKNEEISLGTTACCSRCVMDKRTHSVVSLFRNQVKRLRDDPERRKALEEKAAKAEKELDEFLSQFDTEHGTPEYTASTGNLLDTL